jgi:hypothetical protein
MSNRRRGRTSAAQMERVALVLNTLFFLTLLTVVIGVMLFALVGGRPLEENPWTPVATLLLTATGVVFFVMRVLVRRAHARERRLRYTTASSGPLDLPHLDPATGMTLRVAGHAPEPPLVSQNRASDPEAGVTVPLGEVPRFGPVLRWDLVVFVVLMVLCAPPLIWFRLSSRDRRTDWESVGPPMIILVVISAGIAVLVLVARATVRGFRENAVRRRTPTAVVFSARRHAALTEALGMFAVTYRARHDPVVALTLSRLELWTSSQLSFAVGWHDVIHVRPGRVNRGRWPIERSSRAILVRIGSAGAEIDLPLTPVAAPLFGRAHANDLLDEFRIRARLVAGAGN